MVKILKDKIVNPNVIYLPPHEPIDENEPINLAQEILPRCPDIRIENGKLVRLAVKTSFH